VPLPCSTSPNLPGHRPAWQFPRDVSASVRSSPALGIQPLSQLCGVSLHRRTGTVRVHPRRLRTGDQWRDQAQGGVHDAFLPRTELGRGVRHRPRHGPGRVRVATGALCTRTTTRSGFQLPKDRLWNDSHVTRSTASRHCSADLPKATNRTAGKRCQATADEKAQPQLRGATRDALPAADRRSPPRLTLAVGRQVEGEGPPEPSNSATRCIVVWCRGNTVNSGSGGRPLSRVCFQASHVTPQ